jgi:GNAT superfamily N-acetyltransferase
VIKVAFEREATEELLDFAFRGEAIARFKDISGLDADPDTDQVIYLCNNNAIVFATLRDDQIATGSNLIGTCVLLLDQNYLFRKGAKVAHMLLTYLRPEYQGQGAVYLLFDHVLAWLRIHGYDFIFGQFSLEVDLSKVLQKYNLRIIEYGFGGVLWV